MGVTPNLIAGVIEQIYTCKPIVQENLVAFGLENKLFKAEVMIEIYDHTPETGDEMPPQAARMWLWFNDGDGSRMDLSLLPFDKVLDCCYRLQCEIDWGTLCPEQLKDGGTDITLYRGIDIKSEDIRMAHDGDTQSELLRALDHLCSEWELLSPVIAGVASGQIIVFENIGMLLGGRSSEN